MAKMFYSLEEVQEKLGKNAEEIKQLVSEGSLREFRDGAKIMFKVNEVDELSSAGGSPDDAVVIPPDDAHAEGSSIGLMPLGDTADDLALSLEESAAPVAAGDLDQSGSQYDMDLEASGSGNVDLTPMGESADQISLDDSAAAETAEDKDGTVVTSHGVNVLDDSDSDFDDLDVDPMAQTQVAPDLADQVHLDSGSSGSGLLDLTREADDTSLGAELLEEIYPGAEEGAIETQVPTGLDIPEQTTAALADQAESEPQLAYKQVAEIMDPASGAFGAMMVVPLLFLILMAFIVSAGVSDVQPAFLNGMSDYNLYIWIGGIVLTLLIGGIGILVTGQSAGPAKPKKAKTPKAKKEKKKPKKK